MFFSIPSTSSTIFFFRNNHIIVFISSPSLRSSSYISCSLFFSVPFLSFYTRLRSYIAYYVCAKPHIPNLNYLLPSLSLIVVRSASSSTETQTRMKERMWKRRNKLNDKIIRKAKRFIYSFYNSSKFILCTHNWDSIESGNEQITNTFTSKRVSK